MQQANQSFFYTTDDGVDVFIEKGKILGDKDPVLKGREVFFDTVANLDK